MEPLPPPIVAPPPMASRSRKRKPPIAARIILICAIAFGAFLTFRVVQFASYLRKHPFEKAPGQSAFDNANRQIISGRDGVAFGNTAEAEALAREYSKTLKILRETFFTKGNKDAFSISKGEFLTYCHLSADNCVFLVHVPELRHFVSEAKVSLADLAWMNAQSILQTKLAHPPKTLALGVKGALLYNSILIGDYVSDPTSAPGGDGIKTRGSGFDGMELLYPFFQSEERLGLQ